MKPYRATSLKGAEREVRSLRKQRAHMLDLLDKYAADRKAMAMLAADTPQFFNPIVAAEAQSLRDRILAGDAR